MWIFSDVFDVIVIGAGHAGCEAAYVAAQMGAKTLLLTMNLDSIAKMSCNPAIGGTAKGHIVREIDALGGIMGKMADQSAIHLRMLNGSKGPAVRSPRAQIDRHAYQTQMKYRLENTENLFLKQGTAASFIVENKQVKGINTLEGVSYLGHSTILCSGTFMQGMLHTGHTQYAGGRGGDMPCLGISQDLKRLGFHLERLKTGTPPRVHKRSIDFSKLERQPTEDNVKFSFDLKKASCLEKKDCYIAYTNEKTKEIIQKDLQKSALFSGNIQGAGPRYCPSIEDKIVRFSDKQRHQLFIEPEGLLTEEYYINGLSTSLPLETQIQILHSIEGFENAEIIRFAYAIEYDYAVSGQISASLETKKIKSLFFAGQINGTTGYEEAAAQGLIAAINAVNKIRNLPSFILQRSESYIGVMIDDLITKKINEPYRMFTSRAEHRLLLRQDNADLRLRHHGYVLNLISKQQYDRLEEKKKIIEKEKIRLSKIYRTLHNTTYSLAKFLRRPEVTYTSLLQEFSEDMINHGEEINTQIETEIKYEGYLSRQKKEVEKLQHIENIMIPSTFCYKNITGLRSEAREKLLQFCPPSLGAASRLSGINPSDISILMVALKKQKS